MQIETIKRWHWCVIGVAVGCTVAAISLWAGPKEPVGAETVTHAEFERTVIDRVVPFKRFGRWKAENLRNLRVHPPHDGIEEFITYEYDAYGVGTDGKAWKEPKAARLIPSQKTYAGMAKSELGKDVHLLTATQYLEKFQQHLTKIDAKRRANAMPLNWKRAYIEEPRVAYAVYGGAGLVIIGGIWPTILGLLMGAGLGRPVPEKLMDISKYKGDSKRAEKKPEPSDDDMDRLKALEEQLEASLRAGAHERVATVDAAAPEPQVKKLVGGSAASDAVVPLQKGDKGYGADQGDFYPTEIHGKKK
ncbi:MAG TPA: hypothetical protein VEA69_00940 [Tepidisphaeraceae bacterium]|nr:hypothetical protein [Tepidisphaeraceae bacterium]